MSRTALENCGNKRSPFCLWIIVIAISLASTGLVGIQPATVWAQEEAATENAPVQPPENTPESDPTEENELGKKFDRTVFNAMMRKGQQKEAAEKIDALLADDPTDANALSMSLTLARLVVAKDPSAAGARLSVAVDRVLAMKSVNSQTASLLATSTDYIVPFLTSLPLAERVGIIDRILGRLNDESKSQFASSIQLLVARKARILMQGSQEANAKAILDEQAQTLLSRVDVSNSPSVMSLVRFTGIYNSVLSNHYPEASKKLNGEAESIALKMFDKEKPDVADFTPLYTLKSAEIRSLTKSNPTAGEILLKELDSQFEKLKQQSSENESSEFQTLAKNMQSLHSGIEPALMREKMIGTEPIKIDAASFVGMSPTTMEDLKGKVVLIDFWAVWCGPCIATFPHLIEWHEEFSDRGLVILGATRFYGYQWDDEKGKAVVGKDVSPKAELAMLEKFRESHKLHHGFFVSPKTSTYSKDFGVSGIPQAVLIDKQGKIRMIRVGSGEANAKALHAKIAELLAE